MKKFTISVFTMIFLVGMGLNTPLFAVTHTIQVGNFYFDPSSLNVEVGDIVKWVWVEGSHTTTSTSVPAGAASWDQPINSGNQSYSYTVTTAGTYNYHCTPHAGMGMVGSFVATAPANTLAVTPPNQNVSALAGSTAFTVTSNTSWNASSDQAWCTVTNSGTGNGTIIASYSANTSTSGRVATITVSASGVSNQVVTVTQAGEAKTLNVNPPSQSVSASAGTTDFSVSSNSSWTVTSDATWCTVTSSGTGNGTLFATYEENGTTAQRTANISVLVSGLTPVIVQVIQDGSAVGIPEGSAGNILVYPNPARDLINVSLDNNSDDTRISLIDMTGKVLIDRRNVAKNNQITLNVAGFPRGYYFIKILLSNEQIIRRVVLTE
jgi:plastocyanin